MKMTRISLGILILILFAATWLFIELRPQLINNLAFSTQIIIALILFTFFGATFAIGGDDNSTDSGTGEPANETSTVEVSNESSLSKINDEACYSIYAQKYGVGFDLIDISCVINDDGSAKVTRQSTVTAYTVIGEVYTHLFPGNTATATTHPVITQTNRVYENHRERIRIKRHQEGANHGSSATIQFNPELNPDEEITYKLEQTTSAGIFNDPENYLAWYIDRPTKKLLIQVYLDSQTYESVHSRVNFPNLKQINEAMPHQNEENRARPKIEFQREQVRLELTVDYPIVGLVYRLMWKVKDDTSLEHLSDTPQ